MADDIQDWAIDEALKRCGIGQDQKPISHWRDCTYGKAVSLLAGMIQQHEKPPVDPLYEALKAVVELGRYNTREQTELLRGELAARGLTIVELASQQGGG